MKFPLLLWEGLDECEVFAREGESVVVRVVLCDLGWDEGRAFPLVRVEIKREDAMGMDRWEGLNSYMLVSPYLDSAKPVIDRFELGGEINLHFIGLHLGLSLGQVLDFFVRYLVHSPLLP